MLKRCMLLMVVFIMSLHFVSCTKNTVSTQDNKASNEPIKISMLYLEAGNAPFNENWLVLKEIAKRKNVELELRPVPGRDFQQKRSIVFASGGMPDLIVNSWPAEMSTYAVDGLLLPISDYLDKLPNLKKIINDWNLQSTIEDISELDGKFYVLPDLRKELGGSSCFGIREDVFKANNIPIPQSYDDLLNALTKIKQIYPNTLGMGENQNGKAIMSFMSESFNTNGGYSLPWGYSYHFETNEWYYAPTSQEYKTLLTFLNKMFRNGCLDQEGFIQDDNQNKQKILNSKYMVMPITGPANAKQLTVQLQELGNKDAKVTAIYPLAGPTGLRKVKPFSRNQGGIAVSAAIAQRKDFDKILSFFDWLYYSDEGSIMTTIGFEGVTYSKENGVYKMNQDIKTAANPVGTVSMQKQYGIGSYSLGLYTLAPDVLPESIRQSISDPEQYEFEKYIKTHDMTTQDDPIVKMTIKQKDRAKLLITTLNDYTNQMKMKFIFGEESLDKWDSYVQECNKKGAQELLEIVRTAWKENNKK